jgi:4-azaleucine resistance transporter AzlC
LSIYPETDLMSPPFTFAGATAGARAALVLSPAIIVFGCTFGMLAATHGIGLLEAAVMSAVVCAGTAQFAVLQLWSEPMSWITAGITSLVMNARYVLLGATLRGWFANLPAAKAYLSLFFMYDGNWATATRDHAAGRMDAAHVLGGGVMMCTIWTAATMIGHAFGSLVGEPHKFGLDFVITAFFASLTIGFWRGRSDIAPVCIAIAVAITVDRLVPGPWYIVAGALAGSIVAAVRYQPGGDGQSRKAGGHAA